MARRQADAAPASGMSIRSNPSPPVASRRKPSADDGYEGNRDWEEDRVKTRALLTKGALAVGIIGLVTGALGVGAVAVRGSLERVVEVVVVVDRNTGETTVMKDLKSERVPEVEAMDKADLARYVTARENYFWSFLQRDFDLVATMSAPGVFADYEKQRFQGSQALDKTLGDKTEWKINIINVRRDLERGSGRDRVAEAVVTYEKEVRAVDRNAPPVVSRGVATLRYVYNPRAKLNDRQRMLNPFGFVVQSYRADVDVAGTSVKEGSTN